MFTYNKSRTPKRTNPNQAPAGVPMRPRPGNSYDEGQPMSLALAYAINVRALHARWKKTHAPANTMNLQEDLTTAEAVFGAAVARYKSANDRINPTCSELLAILLALGYRQVAPAEVGEPEPTPTKRSKGGKRIPTAARAAGRSRAELARKVCTHCNRPFEGPAPSATVPTPGPFVPALGV